MKYVEFDETRPMDLVLLGRVAIDFNPAYNDQVKEEFKPLKKVHMFEKFVGGSPANIAVGVTRHGLKAGFFAKVSDDQFGEFVVDYFNEQGIDTSRISKCTNGYREQARRLGKQYPMNAADNALMFRSGNPRPAGDADAILKQGKKFYEELSPESGVFFNKMLDDELLDVLSTPGKAGGGYCTSLGDYEMPFIFANFNGTQHDVEVVTHEAGHAFAAYMNRDRIPYSYVWPSMEACEVHSMSMEFFAWPWAEGFFGADARKFRYSHLAGALTFIPYGTMVDHFQHIVYEHPELTPAQRHEEWKKLAAIYQPWMRLDEVIKSL